MPAVDSLDPAAEPLTPFFTPNAPILICSNPPSTVSTTIPLLEIRSGHLSHFHHKVHIAWDIYLSQRDRDSITKVPENNPERSTSDKSTLYAPLPGSIRLKRTVMFEATSSTTFKDGPDEFAVKIREFSIIDLEGNNEADLQVVEMRVFMDAKSVQAREQQLTMGFSFGKGAREAEPS